MNASLLAAILSAVSSPAPAANTPADPIATEPTVVVPSSNTTDTSPAPTGQPMTVPGPPSLRHRLLVLPYLGAENASFRDEITADAGDFGWGFRVGAMVGWRLNRFLSLNGGIAVDLGNQSPAPEGYRGTLTDSQVAFCPLLHLDAGPVQILAGPKLGLELGSESSGDGGGGPHAQWHGWTYGAQFGLFFQIGPAFSLGALVALDVTQPWSRTCDGLPECPNLSYPPRYETTSALMAALF